MLSVSVHLYVHQCESVYTHTCSILYSLFKTVLASPLNSFPLLSFVSPPILSSPQDLHREFAAAALVPFSQPVLPDSPRPPGCSGPSGEEGLPPGDGPAAARAPALPAGTTVSLLAGPGRRHGYFEVMWSPGAPF